MVDGVAKIPKNPLDRIEMRVSLDIHVHAYMLHGISDGIASSAELGLCVNMNGVWVALDHARGIDTSNNVVGNHQVEGFRLHQRISLDWELRFIESVGIVIFQQISSTWT